MNSTTKKQNKIRNSFSDVVISFTMIIFSLFIIASIVTYFYDEFAFFLGDKILNIFYPDFYKTLQREHVVTYGQLICLVCFSISPHILILYKRRDQSHKNILSDRQHSNLNVLYVLGIILLEALVIYLISTKVSTMPSPENEQDPPIFGFIFIPAALHDWLDKLSLYYCLYFAPLFITIILLRISFICFSWGKTFYSIINFILTVAMLALSTITHFILSSIIGIIVLFIFIGGSFFIGGGVLNSIETEPNKYILENGTSVTRFSGSSFVDSFGHKYTKNGSYFEKED